MQKKLIPLILLGVSTLLVACTEPVINPDTNTNGNTDTDTGGGTPTDTHNTETDTQGGGNTETGGGNNTETGGGSDSTSYIPYDEGEIKMIYNGKAGPVSEPITLPAIDYVRILVPKKYLYVYVWTVSGGVNTERTSGWPGDSITETYNSDYKVYSNHQLSSFNVVFNLGKGKEQTADLSVSGVGNYWLVGGGLVKSDTEPSSGTGAWSPKNPTNIYKNSENYQQPEYIPEPKYTAVSSANDYTNLPVVKNWNKTSTINKYNGKRNDFRDENIYFTITTRFYDGDATNNTHCWDASQDQANDPNWRGDFKGLIEKMDYIKAQGFTAIWITPIVKNASGFDYHGYHAVNFKQVDPRYESEDVSFQNVINEAHKRDMKIILDIVLNHTGNFGEENLFPMFYIDSKNNTTGNSIVRNRTSYGYLDDSYDSAAAEAQYDQRIAAMKNDSSDTNHMYHHEKAGPGWEEYVVQTSQIAGDCVDLNTENPTVANYLIEAYAKFIHMGVDAFRVDTVKHISRLTFNKYFIPAFHYIANKCGNPNFYIFGEVCARYRSVWNNNIPAISAPFYTWKETKSYSWGERATNEVSTATHWNDNKQATNQPWTNNATLNGSTYHAPDHSKHSGFNVIDFPMHWSFLNTSDAYNLALGTDKYYNDATYNVVYVDSHDYGPDGAEKTRYSGGVDNWKDHLNLLYTFRGIPCVFYGTETEFQKGMTIDEGTNIALANSGRAYFGDNLKGTVNVTGFGTYSNATESMATTLNKPLSKHLQKLGSIRLQVPALRRGQYNNTLFSGDGIGFVRRYTSGGVDSVAAVVINGQGNFNSLPDGTYRDLFNNKNYTVSGGHVYVNASGVGSVAILVKQ